MRIATVSPHRGRISQLRNHLRSLAYQTRVPDEVIVSSHGDTAETRTAIVDLLEQHIDAAGIPKQFWAIGEPSEPWRKPLAINWAIRRTADDVDVIATFDVDMILHPEALAELERVLVENPQRYVMCPNFSLPPKALTDDWTYDELREKALTVHWDGTRNRMGPPLMGWGAMQAASRSWWFRVRGLDEEMQWWGSEDHDLAKRAHKTGLKWHWLKRRFACLHQWHEPGQIGNREAKLWKARNMELSFRKLKRFEYVRNDGNWGGGQNL